MPTTSRIRASRGGNPIGAFPSDDNLYHAIDEDFPTKRATKRRKLAIRESRQRTLDGFFSRNIVLARTVDKTVNGVQREVEVEAANTTNGNGAETTGKSKALHIKKKETQTGTKRDVLHDTKPDKRTLRSQDEGSRLRSELSTYFPNYEDVIFDVVPQEPDLLEVNTTIYVTDDASVKAKTDGSPLGGRPAPNHARGAMPRASQNVSSNSWLITQRLDMSPLSKNMPKNLDDPLADEEFAISHRRAERKEKQMRNIEREHAMHEKVQLDRLLDGLLGPDWLRVLGITGVTESEAKKFEPKRRFYIEEVQALVDKFKQWRDEERRQRLEKEAIIAAEREAEQADDTTDADEDESEEVDLDGSELATDGDTEVSTSNPPSSDLNASASRQLQQETVLALKLLGGRRTKDGAGQASRPAPPEPVPDRPPSPITSFYSARHMRELALKRARNSRNQLAFGQLLPDVDEEEFSLPADYLNENVLRASARERRRRKRGSVTNAAGSKTR